jgi:hypothetical protein
MFKPGDIVPGGYRLGERLGYKGFYIHSWRASDRHGKPVLLKIYHTVTSDDYPGAPHDLRSQIEGFIWPIDSFVKLAPVMGLAPWITYHIDYAAKWLILCRKYYPDRLIDRFPVLRAEDRHKHPNQALLQAFQEIATGLDQLRQFMEPKSLTFNPSPDDLLMDGPDAVVADWGTVELEQLIEHSYDGPRPISESDSLAATCYGESLGPHGHADPQYCLAILYFYLRVGHSIFTPLSPGPDAAWDAYINHEAYLKTGQVNLEELPNPRECEIIARALSVNATDRFTTCREFVQQFDAL